MLVGRESSVIGTGMMNVRLPIVLAEIVLLVSALPVGVIRANPGWDYYKDITINGSLVSGTVTSFPVLVSLASDADLVAHAQSDGGDIVFTDQGNTAKYDHEIESYNSGTGALVAWVEVDSLTNGSDKAIRMWYGNAGASDQWNISGTWDSNYVMVQHLQESPDDDVAGHLDSTSNGNNGTPKNFQAGGGGTTDAAGKIDGADLFDGTEDYVTLGVDALIPKLAGASALTGSAWVRLNGLGDSNQVIFCGVISGNANFYNMRIEGSTDVINIIGRSKTSDGAQAVDSLSALTTGQWYHIVGVADFANNINRVYVNGALNNTASSLSYGSSTLVDDGTPTGSDSIGASPSATYNANGTIDEVRVSNVARSGGWITTSYNNQSDTTIASDKFLKSLGSEEETLGVDPVPEVPTILLLGMGLAGVVVVLVLSRRPRVAPLAA